ncbi:hypothetical protein [Sphingomonas alpina]|uniref:Lipoprotein n=1 Tax=Sphingomonas alpina TaxID=653931 RepID=A0A7H0LFA5_9SPHN|nr:hypothetical protein [Sphingomonas alpina]QNQ08358.1 hypothetical protein H3Z74_16600 [Sphingomonas alpina]
MTHPVRPAHPPARYRVGLPILLAACLALAGCGDGNYVQGPAPTPTPTPTPSPTHAPTTIAFSFAAPDASWTSSYADYSLGQEGSIGFATRYEELPVPLQALRGLRHQSRNVSDDVFMYVHRAVDGLRPSARYRLTLSVTLATDAPPGCAGVGGAPGEAVVVKTGLLAAPPANRIVGGTMVRPAFDIGAQSQPGADSVVIGNIAKQTGPCSPTDYETKTLTTNAAGFEARSDANGRLWLFIGTDSGYEGHTALYYLHGLATLTPL